jgi:hypothetical protein
MAMAAASKVKLVPKSVRKCAKSTDVLKANAARSARKPAKKQAILIAKKASAATVKKRKGLHKHLPELSILRPPPGGRFLYTHANMPLIYLLEAMPLLMVCISKTNTSMST